MFMRDSSVMADIMKHMKMPSMLPTMWRVKERPHLLHKRKKMKRTKKMRS